MSVASQWSDFLDGLSRLSGQQWLLRACAPAAAAALLGLERMAGGVVQPWFVAVALAQAVLVTALPDSSACLFLVLLLGVHWALFVPEALSGWVLAAALVLLGLHLATTLASYGPPSLVLHRALLARWARRGGSVAAGTALTWGVARLWPASPGWVVGWVTGLALLVVLAWSVRLTRLLRVRR